MFSLTSFCELFSNYVASQKVLPVSKYTLFKTFLNKVACEVADVLAR